MRIRHAITLCLLLCASWICRADPAPQTREFWRADFIPVRSSTPPAQDATGWRAVKLPHAFYYEHRLTEGGWYRIHWDSAVAPDAPQALYVWHLNLNAAFYFNGERVGGGGRLDPPITRNWNRPHLVELPRALWRPGQNEVWIQLVSEPGWGALSPLEIGPSAVLQPQYEQRHFIQVELVRSLMVVMLVLGLLILLLWLRGREAQYFWFGLSCLLWAAFCSYLTIRDVDVPGGWLRWGGHMSMVVWHATFILFIRRHTGKTHRPGEHLLTVYVLISAVAIAPHGWVWQGFASTVCYYAGAMMMLGVAAQVFRAWRRYPQLALALLVLVLSGLHDLALFFPYTELPDDIARLRLKHHVFIAHYAAPLTLFFMTIDLARRFVRAMNEAAVLNRELETRVAAQGEALRRSYEDGARLNREQAAHEERERIYRDLHDDIGARLLSLVVRAQNPADAETARAALQSLRDVVSQSAHGDHRLPELLADLRAELDGRAAGAKVELDWVQPSAMPDITLSAETALHLTRIVREAVSNVLRHAQAKRLTISITLADDEIQLAIADDGKGMAEGGGSGRGMHNMRARAQALGGAIHWRDAAPGCVVLLHAPLTALKKEATPSA